MHLPKKKLRPRLYCVNVTWLPFLSTGQFSASGTACSNCSAGYFSSVGASACAICPAGSACASTRLNPTVCGAGTFSSAGQTACSTCSLGSYVPVGQSSCVACPPGSACSSALSSPTPCLPGTYATGSQTRCIFCPPGQVCPSLSSAPSNCTVGTYSAGGQTSCLNTTVIVNLGISTAPVPYLISSNDKFLTVSTKSTLQVVTYGVNSTWIDGTTLTAGFSLYYTGCVFIFPLSSSDLFQVVSDPSHQWCTHGRCYSTQPLAVFIHLIFRLALPLSFVLARVILVLYLQGRTRCGMASIIVIQVMPDGSRGSCRVQFCVESILLGATHV
jgi:hypothetical protein